MRFGSARSRIRPVPAGLIGVAAAIAALAASPAQRGTRDRHVYVSVVDRNNLPVTDLTTRDVVVREDGAVRELTSVGRATAPMQIALLADDSQAAQPLILELREGLAAFDQAVATSNPDSEVALWTFGERPTRALDFTPSVAAMTRGIGTVFSRPGSGAYFMEAMIEATHDLIRKGATRPIIVAFIVEDSPEFSTTTEQSVINALKASHAALWTIVLQGRNPGNFADVEQRYRSAVIADDARASGGGSRIILDRTGLKDAYAAVFAGLTAQIDVAYSRPDRLVPPSKLEVALTRPGLRLSAAPRWAGQ